MKRLFAAARIQPAETFIRHTERMKNALFADKINWVEYRNLHLTLKFFGETPDERIPAISDALRKAALSPAFKLHISGIGIFGSNYDPRVIWYAIQDEGKLTSLVKSVMENLKTAGYEPDRQNYVPHLTIGRIRHIRDKQFFQHWLDQYKSVELQSAEISEFHLFESLLHTDGPEYRVLETYPLQ